MLVWVSDGPYTTGQAQVTQAVTVNQPAACSAVSASAPSSVVGGQPVSVDATATCPSGAAVEYTYFAKAAASGTWTLEAAWVSGSWTWNTVGLAAGSYQIVVWASDGPYTTGQAQTEVSVTVSG
ncbi:MAG TPA: hypothetical protein VMV09_03365 [Candidatus Saccharimonadales bacterium]|nr:hypothetical protein [Candidatus Saccharimonadales bacterium]